MPCLSIGTGMHMHTLFSTVFAGSWDSTIRAWDVRTQSCIHVCSQHHSDVYGLTIHSGCPWLLASASRDSTLRFWDLRGLAAGKLELSSQHQAVSGHARLGFECPAGGQVVLLS